MMLVILASSVMDGCSASDQPQLSVADTTIATQTSMVASTPSTPPVELTSIPIVMSAEAIKLANFKYAGVMKRPIMTTLSGPARIVPTLAGEANVGPIMPGRIAKFYVHEGSYVQRGAALAEIETFDLAELKAAYLTASAEALRTEKAFNRQHQLAAEGVGATRDLEIAEAEKTQAIAKRNAAEIRLRGLGITPTQLAGTQTATITLRSPITGVVSKRFASIGDYAPPEKDIFEILNLSTVWADAPLPPEAASELSVGDAGSFQTSGGLTVEGRVVFISPSADPGSHAVVVRLELPNITMLLRPEQFGTASFQSRQKSAIGFVVPVSALEKEEANYFVYKRVSDTSFTRISVRLVNQSNDNAVIRSAMLTERDSIVARGIFYLKSTRLKDELQESD